MTQAIFDRVRLLIGKELKVNPTLVTRTAKLRGQELRADSLDLVNLIMALAIEFGVEMRDDEVQKIVTVQDIINFLAGTQPPFVGAYPTDQG